MKEQYILLVEDNPDDEALTLRALKKNNIKNDVKVARDGVEALALLLPEEEQCSNHNQQLPALVLLDLNLPKINGLEVLRRLRSDARTQRLLVVILTSSGESKDVISSYNFGANSFIRKPVDFKEFNDMVRQMGRYWLEINHPPVL